MKNNLINNDPLIRPRLAATKEEVVVLISRLATEYTGVAKLPETWIRDFLSGGDRESDDESSVAATTTTQGGLSQKNLIINKLIKNGRPTPELELKEKVRTVERHFKTETQIS